MKTPSYEEVRERIERRYRRFSLFIFHIIMAIVTVIILWLIDPTPQEGTLVVAVLWFGVLLFHAVKIYLDGLQDQAIERTWQRLSGSTDKKPERMVRLADDAELELVGEEAVTEHLESSQYSSSHSSQRWSS